MSNNGAALLGGLLLGGLVVGAAMSADKPSNRPPPHHHHHNHLRAHHRGQQRVLHAQTYCICGAIMTVGHIKQGTAKCNNLNCQKLLTGTDCFYCPNGSNARHRNGFFYCRQCALQVRRNGNQVMQVQQVAQPASARAPANVPAAQHYAAQAAAAKPGQHRVVKSGWMSKKGEWFNTAYKKRWFKLWSNKKMAYLTEPSASYTKGYADFTSIIKIEKKGKHGFEVSTKERVWCFLCANTQDRDDWFHTIQNVCLGVPFPVAAQPVQAEQQYAVPMQPLPQPQPQPQYTPVYPQLDAAASQTMASASSVNEAQPGMVGYNAGNMYGSQQNNAILEPGASNMENDSVAPPAAYSFGASAPFEEDVLPSAPFEEEGAVTAQ